MNGIHDMGGMTTFGPVPTQESEAFHAEWEKRLDAVARAMWGRLVPLDEFRASIERLDPAVYLTSTYYERWLAGLERLAVEKCLLTREEMQAALDGWTPQPAIPAQAARAGIQQAGDREIPRYRPGDRVRVRNVNSRGHTRMPRYVRGRSGTVERYLSAQALPDAVVAGHDEHRSPVYAVHFTARELWGEGASARDSVVIDLWEDYLLPDKGEKEPS